MDHRLKCWPEKLLTHYLNNIVGTFRFKQFSVCDDKATMKVGTDAVLLGAWADVSNARTILDIGTGTGILALMTAQRSVAHTQIDAIEISEQAANQARENSMNSPWSQSIYIHHGTVQEFYPGKRYDLILCNPPYFIKSLLPPDAERTGVRHDVSLSFDDLLDSVKRLIQLNGRFSVILPPAEASIFIDKAHKMGFHISARATFLTRKEKPVERILLEFTQSATAITKEEIICLYSDGDHWSNEYWDLTQEFYLARR